MAKAKQEENTVYQLKIALVGIQPPIWRRVLIPGKFTLEEVHAVIQVSMGWENAHLHQFVLGKRETAVFISHPDFELDGRPVKDRKAVEQTLAGVGFNMDALPPKQLDRSNLLDECSLFLDDVVSREGATLVYEYDFGDSWAHEILVEKIFALKPDVEYPACIAGARCCPPEDCGGIGGYADLLEALRDPKRDDHEEAVGWVGEDFDSEYFDLDETNAEVTYYYEDCLVSTDDKALLDDGMPSAEQIEEAIDMLREQTKAFIHEVVPSPDGFALRFPGGIPLVNAVVPQFVTITYTRQPKLKVVYEIGPESEAVWVRITGPQEELRKLKETLGIDD